MDTRSIICVITLILFLNVVAANVVYLDGEGRIIDPQMYRQLDSLQSDTSRLELILLETKQDIRGLNASIRASQEDVLLATRIEIDTTTTKLRNELIQVIDERTDPLRVVPPILAFNIALVLFLLFIWSGVKVRSKLVSNTKDHKIAKLESELAALTMQLELFSTDNDSTSLKFFNRKELENWNSAHKKRSKDGKSGGLLSGIFSKLPIIKKNSKEVIKNGSILREHEKTRDNDGPSPNDSIAFEDCSTGIREHSGQVREAVPGERHTNGSTVSASSGIEKQSESGNSGYCKKNNKSVKPVLSKSKLKSMTKAELIDLYSKEQEKNER